jgi:hypothetical protein
MYSTELSAFQENIKDTTVRIVLLYVDDMVRIILL